MFSVSNPAPGAALRGLGIASGIAVETAAGSRHSARSRLAGVEIRSAAVRD
jgi:hypothetical protein